MISVLLADILKSGTVAFLGCKITKAMGQKEISELIGGTGWCIVGVDIIMIVQKPVKVLIDSGRKTAETIDRIQGAFQGIGSLIDKLKDLTN